MTRTCLRLLTLLFVCGLLVGSSSQMLAQRAPTIAAAANLNFALTEVAAQFGRDTGKRWSWCSARRAR